MLSWVLQSRSAKGLGGLIIGIALVIALGIYAGRFALLIVLGVVAAVVFLHFWNKRPVKTPEDDQIRLNLDK